MKRLIWLLLLAGLGGSVGAAELSLEFDKRAVEWGKPLRGYIVFRGNTDHGGIDLSPWSEGFHVDSGYAEVGESDAGGVVRRDSVRLYPRTMGQQAIPALTHGGVRSEPLAIEVLAPQPGQGGPVLNYRVSAQGVSAGEQLTVRVRLLTRDERVRVSIDPIDQAGLHAQVLAPRRERLPDGGVEHRLGWSLHFAEAGRQRLELPPVRYTLFGRDLYRFYLPLLSVEVAALPGYVPVTVPVGRLEFDSRILASGGDRAWQVVVESDGLLPVGLPELERQLIERSGAAPERLAREQRQEIREDGVYSILEYRAPLPPWLSGLGPGPRLEVQVFDPRSRRIQRQLHELPKLWRMPVWFAAVLSLLGVALALPLARRLLLRYRRWRTRRALIAAVNRVSDVRSLRRLLLAQSGCRTLGEWASGWAGAPASAFADRLNMACFGPSQAAELALLKDDLVRVIRNGLDIRSV